jgi:hypothetical protein
LRSSDTNWPNQDVYLLSSRQDVELALARGSVKPYQALESGGRFMLGLESGPEHTEQNRKAVEALRFEPCEIEKFAKGGFVRAAVLPLKKPQFDLADLANQAALRCMELMFGFRDQVHLYLDKAMQVGYQQLVFQIVGRHFVSESGMPPSDTPAAKEGKAKLLSEIREAANQHEQRAGAEKTVIERLVHIYGSAECEN